MYYPPGGSLHEFIELQNVGTTPLDVSGFYFEASPSPFAQLRAGRRRQDCARA